MVALKIESTPGIKDGVRILRLSGGFVLQAVNDFQAAVRAGNDPVTIVDLTEVTFMDSAALGAVMGLHLSSEKSQRKYALVGASVRLRALFDVARVAGILVTFRTAEEAEAKLTEGAGAASADESQG
jgi:anti-anti-sigma factor